MNLKKIVLIVPLLASVNILADSPELIAFKKQSLLQLEALERQGSISPMHVKLAKTNLEEMTDEEYKAAKEMQAMMQNEQSKMSPDDLRKQNEASENAMKQIKADFEKMTPEQEKQMDKSIDEMGKMTSEERNKASSDFLKQVRDAKLKKP